LNFPASIRCGSIHFYPPTSETFGLWHNPHLSLPSRGVFVLISILYLY
jgi:hypothetical protein